VNLRKGREEGEWGLEEEIEGKREIGREGKRRKERGL
jgi:hypothetical protein